MTQLKRGNLVRILTHTRLDDYLKNTEQAFVGTVVECRHKTNAYKIFAVNNPFAKEPYWISGDKLELL